LPGWLPAIADSSPCLFGPRLREVKSTAAAVEKMNRPGFSGGSVVESVSVFTCLAAWFGEPPGPLAEAVGLPLQNSIRARGGRAPPLAMLGAEKCTLPAGGLFTAQ